MAGRRPKPTALKLLAGNPGRRPLNADEPQPRAGVPDCPSHLDKEAKAEWERISVELELAGLLTQVDRAALAGYCQTWSRWVEASKKIKKFGTVVKSPSGYPMQSPYFSIEQQAMKQMRSFLVEFGMTPSSRSRLTPTKPAGEADPLGRFLEQGKREA